MYHMKFDIASKTILMEYNEDCEHEDRNKSKVILVSIIIMLTIYSVLLLLLTHNTARYII